MSRIHAHTQSFTDGAYDVDRRYDELFSHRLAVNDESVRWALYNYRPRYMALYHALRRHLEGKRETIVDLGCGSGAFIYLCAGLGFKALVGVDFFVSKGSSYLDQIDRAQIVQADFNEERYLNAFEDESVDCIVSSETFEHLFNHPLGYLLEGWRVLRTGGLLLFNVPNPCTFANAWRLIAGRSITWGAAEFAKRPRVARDGAPGTDWDIHYMDYAPSDIGQVLSLLPGARIIERGFVGTAPSPDDATLRKVTKRVLRALALSNTRLVSTSQYWIALKDTRPGTPG